MGMVIRDVDTNSSRVSVRGESTMTPETTEQVIRRIVEATDRCADAVDAAVERFATAIREEVSDASR